jgi:hypothetical protein
MRLYIVNGITARGSPIFLITKSIYTVTDNNNGPMPKRIPISGRRTQLLDRRPPTIFFHGSINALELGLAPKRE